MLYSEYFAEKRHVNRFIEDINFVNWLNTIEQKVNDIYGVGLLSLPDVNYIADYDRGTSVDTMVNEILDITRNIIHIIKG